MTILLAALRSRWTWAGLAAAALVAAFLAGRYAAPARVETRTEVVHSTASMEATEWGSAVREKITEGPVQIVTHTVTRLAPEPPRPEFWPEGCPACPACPPIQETTITETRGAVVTERATDARGASAQAAQTEDRQVATRVAESARPDWAVDGGALWPVRDLRLVPVDVELTLERRIAGPLWLGLSVMAPTDDLGDLRAYRAGLRLRGEF